MRIAEWAGQFIPESITEPADRHTAALIVGLSLALGVWGLPLALVMWCLQFQTVALCLVVLMLFVIASSTVLRLTRSLAIGGHYTIVSITVSLHVLLLVSGGYTSPFLLFSCIPPLVIWLFSRGVARIVWLCAFLASIWLVYLTPFYGRSGAFVAADFLLPFCHTALIVMVLTTAWFLERRSLVALAKLESTNEELSSSQQELIKLTHDLAMTRDEAIKANRAKSSFLANMSHELRTPLNAVIGYSELLIEEEEDKLDDASMEDLHKILGAGQHLLSLISDILDISKIEAGRIELHPEPFSVGAFVDELSPVVMPMAMKNGNVLEISCPPGVGKANTDATRLRQILLNLLSNACKFTHDGSITLRVVQEARKDGDWLRFDVTDTGIGIEEEKLTKVFNAFIQADSLTTRKYGGTGLGLAISQRFARLLGGDIEVQSESGVGSTFTVTLPTEAPEVKENRILARRRTNTTLNAFVANRPLVLVIDDDPNVHDLLMRILRRERYNVVTAFSGEEGLRLAKELKPAIITLDALMPKMSGWDVLGVMKAHAALSNIPVIMITISDEIERGFALGASEFLTKPIERERLLGVLESFRSREGPVLVVEDDANTRELIVRMLNRNGWDTLEARHGEAALSLLDTLMPSLIITDLMMPVMDGFSLIERLGRDEEWRTIPVIVLTAMELSQDESGYLTERIENVLQKGATPLHELEAHVVSLLSGLDEGEVQE